MNREDRDGDLPPGDHVVDPGEQSHGQEVDPDEDRHQDDGYPEAEPGDVARVGVVDTVPVVGEIAHDREALHRRDRDRLQVGRRSRTRCRPRCRRRSAGTWRFRRRPGTSRRARRGTVASTMTTTPGDDPVKYGGTADEQGLPLSGANSQPEPMMDVSDAQAAPTSPSSRLRPTSAGWVTAAGALESVAMIDSSFLVPRSCPEGPCHAPRGIPLRASELSVVQSA